MISQTIDRMRTTWTLYRVAHENGLRERAAHWRAIMRTLASELRDMRARTSRREAREVSAVATGYTPANLDVGSTMWIQPLTKLNGEHAPGFLGRVERVSRNRVQVGGLRFLKASGVSTGGGMLLFDSLEAYAASETAHRAREVVWGELRGAVCASPDVPGHLDVHRLNAVLATIKTPGFGNERDI